MTERSDSASVSTVVPSAPSTPNRSAGVDATTPPHSKAVSSSGHSSFLDVFEDAVSSIATPRTSQARVRRAEHERERQQQLVQDAQAQQQAERAHMEDLERQRRKLIELEVGREREAMERERLHAQAVEQQRKMEEERAKMLEEQRRQEEARLRAEAAEAEKRHRDAVEFRQKRESMRIEAERERIEQHLRLEAENSQRAKARQAEILAAEMQREQREREKLFEQELRRAQEEKRRMEAERRAQEAAIREAQLRHIEREKELARLLRAEQEALAREIREKEQARLAKIAHQEQEARERLAREAREQEMRIAREERERELRMAREERERLEHQRREQERQLRFEREERERRIREDKERRRHARMERERLAREEQERIAREKEEQRLAVVREEQRKVEEAERVRREQLMRSKQSRDALLATRVEIYEAQLQGKVGAGPSKLPLEERALKRAKREADDEDRATRTFTRRREDMSNDDDTMSIPETERSTMSRASDASQLTAVLSKLHIVSRQQPPAVKSIMSQPPEAKRQPGGPNLRFALPDAPPSELRIVAHPGLPWLTFLAKHRLPHSVDTPTNVVAPAAETTTKAIGSWIRTSIASVTSFETASGAQPWAIKPVGPYHDMNVRYFPGFTVHGLAFESQPIHDAAVRMLTTPGVMRTLLWHLDLPDIRMLHDVSRATRHTLGRPDVQEHVLCRFLGPAGYVTWPDLEDPIPLTLHDCEAFHMYMYAEGELPIASHAYLTGAHHLDKRIPRLARTAARAYSKVLARIRMQPGGVPDMPESWLVEGPGGQHQVGISSPCVPGYVATFRAWVPCIDDEDEPLYTSELSRVERELFVSGIWRFLQRGDVVVNATNAQCFVYNGDAFASMSTQYDPAGHLPPFINMFLFPVTYYDWIQQQTYMPVIYLDVLPWRAQILTSLSLMRDNVEVAGPQGQMYRIAKWIYRASMQISVPEEASPSGIIESVNDAHSSWNGRVIIEAEGTSEHVAELIRRLVAPTESAAYAQTLLEAVLQGKNPSLKIPPVPEPESDVAVLPTYPWRLLRYRSQPGCIWITPVS